MRRDLDLVRRLLLVIEARPRSKAPTRVAADGYSDEVLAYHRWLLVDGGLAEGNVDRSDSARGLDAEIVSLNAAGHDFLDAARNDAAWDHVLGSAREFGVGLPIGVLAEMLKARLRELLERAERS